MPQRLLGWEKVGHAQGANEGKRLAEQFPGELKPHEIYDRGSAEFDDFAEQTVMPGHVFVLGDNRDLSADSRVPLERFGVGQVRMEDIRGRPLFFTWGGGTHPMGAPIR